MSKTNTMNTKNSLCKEINPWLVDYAGGELIPANRQRVEEHLTVCKTCREEYALMQRLEEETRLMDEACQPEMASIDWEETAQTIGSLIPFKKPDTPKSWESRFHFLWNALAFNWKLAVPALAGVFLLGIWLGIFLSTSTGKPGSQDSSTLLSKRDLLPTSSLDRLENTLARKEVANYFDQTQLVLTDVMKQCNTDESFSLQNHLDIRRVRALLSKGRHFKDNLNDPRLMSSQELLEKIEWLLYEILITGADNDSSCQKLQRLQDYIREQRLLLKIRLAGEELSYSEV